MKRHRDNKKINVLIVEDSAVIREFLRNIVGRDDRFEVCGIAASAEEALRILERVSPDVISLDIWLPGIDGFAATRKIMSQRPTPIVVVSASVESGHSRIAMKALEAGAVAVLEKPSGTTDRDYEAFAERLCTQLAIMSQIKLVRQYVKQKVRVAAAGESYSQEFAMVGIACSTGGPSSLVELLNGLGPAFGLPILLVQHMTAGFLDSFAAWLESACPFRVVVVEQRLPPQAGSIYLVRSGSHMVVDGGLVGVRRGEPVCSECPSGTVLFSSMARSLGSGAIGVLLTGMGADGAEGLLEMRQAGGYTIAEDKSSAVVYGMPGAAVDIGAVCESLPLQEIAPRLRQLAALAHEAAVALTREGN